MKTNINNKLALSILFGISGIVFFLLFLDSHYKHIQNQLRWKKKITVT